MKKRDRFWRVQSLWPMVWVTIGIFYHAMPLLAGTRDVSQALRKESAKYFANHQPPKHHLRNFPGGNLNHQDLHDPGGTGYGYYFYDSALLWTNSTSIDYYILTPSQLGGTSTDWLYLTTTCRAQLGVEALVGFYTEEEAEFMVFDWARTDHWQVAINLPTYHPEYLGTRPDEYGNLRQMCHVRNSTYVVSVSGSQTLWENQVLLFNFTLGDWDLVYSYRYATDTPNANWFSPGAIGFWGPIVETFGTYDRTHAIGFERVRFFQDGKPNFIWLTSANSYLQSAPAFHPITVAPNRSFAVYAGTTNLETYPFAITGLRRDAPSATVTLQVDTLLARDFQAYSGAFFGGEWSWLKAGSPIAGNGRNQALQAPAPLRNGYYKVGWKYNTSTLCVVVNDPRAAFTLSPDSGSASPEWISEPITNRWDKSVIGLHPGSYRIDFRPIAGFTVPPPSQNFSVGANGITTIQGMYGP